MSMVVVMVLAMDLDMSHVASMLIVMVMRCQWNGVVMAMAAFMTLCMHATRYLHTLRLRESG